MKILIVDDERIALEELNDTVREVEENAEIDCFDNYESALFEARIKKYGVAFLDIAMPGCNGLELSKKLKDINPDTNIIFVTGYSHHAVSAFKLNASGYIMKPASDEDVRNALDNLRIPIKFDEELLRVRCFGNFEAFKKNQPIKFKRAKTKELFAYLVNLKGASANTNELCAVLFPEDTASSKSNLRNLVADLKWGLRACDSDNVFISSRNSFSIDPDKIDCDFYRFLDGDVAAINSYHGEYMSQYDWAEMTNAMLYHKGA